MVGGLYVVAREKPSVRSVNPQALQTVVVTADKGCQNFADFWLGQSGLGLDPSIIHGLTNCWQDAGGTWFVPTSINDVRLPADFRLTDSERASTEASREAILAELVEFDYQTRGPILQSEGSLYTRYKLPIVGHLRGAGPYPVQRSRYARAMQAFLMSPQHALLAQYVGWMMQPRIEAYETLRNDCTSKPDTRYLVTVCRGLEDTLSIFYPPWTWDMRDAVNLEAFLAQRIRSGVSDDAPVG